MPNLVVHLHCTLNNFVECLRPVNRNTRTTQNLGRVTCNDCLNTATYQGAVSTYGRNFTFPALRLTPRPERQREGYDVLGHRYPPRHSYWGPQLSRYQRPASGAVGVAVATASHPPVSDADINRMLEEI